MVRLVLSSNSQLLPGHVDANHLASFADQLSEDVAIPSAAATEIEDPAARERFGQDNATAVVAA